MISMKKTPGRDFLVLNLSDPQLGDGEWEAGHPNRKILEDCVGTLVARVHPDLITVSGDLAWAGNDRAYDALADFLDTFGIPWAPVWGNHDNQEGPEKVEAVVSRYLTHPLCVYERGPADLGNGNYVIRIEEDGRPVSALFMLDSHDRAPYVNEAGVESNEWAKLIPEQLAWYREQIAALEADGCRDSAIILHIPIYAYREAFAAAFRQDIDPKTVLLRATWMYDMPMYGYPNRGNFLCNMLLKPEIAFSSTQHRAVTYVREVAAQIRNAVLLPGGIYNYGSADKNAEISAILR